MPDNHEADVTNEIDSSSSSADEALVGTSSADDHSGPIAQSIALLNESQRILAETNGMISRNR